MDKMKRESNELLINGCADYGLDAFVGKEAHAPKIGLKEILKKRH